MKKTNLKERLIESGINYIRENGVETLSLREIAKECNVTHASPYKHFKNKDDFLKCLANEISIMFGKFLIKDIDIASNDIKSLVQKMGENFIAFATTYPNFFDMLFITSSWSETILINNVNEKVPGFNEFRDIVIRFKEQFHIDISVENMVIQLWSYVLGLALMVSHNNIKGLSEEKIAENIKNVVDLYIKKGA